MLDAEVKKARHAEKVAIEKAKEADKRASQAKDARKKAEEVQKKLKMIYPLPGWSIPVIFKRFFPLLST